MFYKTVNVAPNIILRSEKKPVLVGLNGSLQYVSGMQDA